jgi:hypothetical protein
VDEFASPTHRATMEIDEVGNSIRNEFVATGTDSQGNATAQDCNGWTSAKSTDFATFGFAAFPTNWSERSDVAACNFPLHLYCVER